MARSMKDLAIVIGKGGGKDDDEEGDAPDSEREEGEEGGDEDVQLEDAFHAAQEGDKESFIASMKGAIRSCIDSYGKK